MPQATDIILNSAGYMVQPGTPTNPGYKRLQDGHPEGLTQRSAITDFFGGQLRSHQLERDRFYDSLCIGPALGGQGVAPWSRRLSLGVPSLGTYQPKADAKIPMVFVRDRLYFAIEDRLFASVTATPNGATTTAVIYTAPATITDLTIYASYGMLIAYGSAHDIEFYNTNTSTAVVLMANERAFKIAAYNGYALWSDARTASMPSVIRMVKGTGIDFRNVSYDVTDIVDVGAELMLITKQALFTFNGRVVDALVPNPSYPGQPNPQIPGQEWRGEFVPFYQQGPHKAADDFVFVSGFGGRTLAWIAGGVHELVPSGDRAGWRSTGLTGVRCFGGTVAEGYAIVSIQSEDNRNEVWCYDGNGWWCIVSEPMPASGLDGVLCWPFPTNGAGGSGNRRSVGFFQHNTGQLAFYVLTHQPSDGTYAYAPSANLITPLIDAGDRDKIKAWRKIGATFSSPEILGNASSMDSTQVLLDYSINAGATWVNVHQRTTSGTNPTAPGLGNSLPAMNFDMEAALAGVTSRYIMLRVRWDSIIDWSPILTGLWVEHETLQYPARRRKWTLRIHARDQEVDRDGVMLTRTGRQLIDELWTAWESDAPLTFRDIDYDDDPTQRTVRIVGISEAATQPFDHGEWGDSVITLNLVEV